jgi:hypothetical protein
MRLEMTEFSVCIWLRKTGHQVNILFIVYKYHAHTDVHNGCLDIVHDNGDTTNDESAQAFLEFID